MSADFDEAFEPQPINDSLFDDSLSDLLWEDSDLYALLGVNRDGSVALSDDERQAA